MLDAVVFESIVAGSAALAAALGLSHRRRTALPVVRSIRFLPRRHRRQARKIIAIAREHDARHSKGSLDAFTARETLRAYLPETIAAYLAVPPALRASRRAGRISPDDDLKRQLSTLRSGLERLRDADADVASSRMAVNAAFLSERFGPAPVSGRLQTSAVLNIVHALTAYLRSA